MRLRAGLAAFALTCAVPAIAQTGHDEAAIRGRLHAWAEAFNRRDADRACELFAEDLVAVIRGAEDSGKAAMCDRLRRALATPDRRMHYSPAISEVLVSGDLAAVTLVWTLTIEQGGRRIVSTEKGLDVFRRGPDGVWRIARFMAFSPERDE